MIKKIAAAVGIFFGAYALAWAVNNIQISGPGGRVYTMRTTDNAGVHTPWTALSSSGGTELFTSGNPGYVNVGAATGLAQGSTTSGQTGSLVMGAVSTAAPSYTTAQTSPTSLDPFGNTRVASGSDPCQARAHVYKTISQTTSTELFTGTASNRTYVCHVFIMANAAESISLVSGTGSVCGTSVGPLVGGTTALSAISANGGYSLGNGGFAIAKTDTDADNVCLIQAGAVQLTGVLSYVVAP